MPTGCESFRVHKSFTAVGAFTASLVDVLIGGEHPFTVALTKVILVAFAVDHPGAVWKLRVRGFQFFCGKTFRHLRITAKEQSIEFGRELRCRDRKSTRLN